jgi:hypothetical protein
VQTDRVRLDQLKQKNAPCGHTGEVEAVRARSTEAMTTRRFPAPWRADRIPGGYIVRDANGQALAYIYSFSW